MRLTAPRRARLVDYFDALHVHHGSAAIYLLEAHALAEDVRL